jgi:hypothetical protein
MYTNNREAYRNAFHIAWHKHQKRLPLEPVEKEIINVILSHPEYQLLLDSIDSQPDNYPLEENPFLHMSLHLAIREQILTNRPFGITDIYKQLLKQETFRNAHEVEHHMMECLAQMLWSAQQNGCMPGDEEYLGKMKDVGLQID